MWECDTVEGTGDGEVRLDVDRVQIDQSGKTK